MHPSVVAKVINNLGLISLLAIVVLAEPFFLWCLVSLARETKANPNQRKHAARSAKSTRAEVLEFPPIKQRTA